MQDEPGFLGVKFRWLRNRARARFPDISPVFVGGCARSGTTLMRLVLDRHPNICCGAETNFVAKPIHRLRDRARDFQIPLDELRGMIRTADSHAQFLRTFFQHFAAREGKPRWAEKSPRNVLYIDRIFRCFPNARFVHMIRDGRDVACSLRTHHSRSSREQWLPVSASARRWRRRVRAGARFRGDHRYLEVRYEDLVSETERELRRICNFLDEDFSPAMLDTEKQRRCSDPRAAAPGDGGGKDGIYRSSVSRWRSDMSPGEARAFCRIAGDQLIELGYESDDSWPSRVSS